MSKIGPTVFLVARIGSKTLEIAQIVSSELDSTSFIIDWAIFVRVRFFLTQTLERKQSESYALLIL